MTNFLKFLRTTIFGKTERNLKLDLNNFLTPHFVNINLSSPSRTLTLKYRVVKIKEIKH